jgi:hypothetical protein
MKHINILYGYSGTLKTSISNRALDLKGYHSNCTANQDYIDMYCNLLGKPFEEARGDIDSINLIINFYNQAKFLIESHDKIILNRSIVDFMFYYYNSRNLMMNDEYAFKLESELVNGAKKFLLVNKSNIIFSKLSEKNSRELTDYWRQQDLYCEMIIKYYPECIVKEIYDDTINQVIDSVVDELI